ncbi:xanthine dehydrogenase YagR molybdenum-binding subunit [Verrucomicrobium sp. GAS474]|uniref:xanthine dehydrogenase family protein molybdopterin-binding subunit n=1 Tax=Verrucomicrobium sp. GAS474 TaxID=1882831 RepID=UPI00087B33CA|nr:xanthine dehydrogenase family protein molybdopterin-binding subunit [Verrucomicrobium sp. GAS474]SDU12034.1 xanthine dehydrogenase YagR molybdenum-binding subunit [Verrucomicrobium sp. GAS474]
MSADGPIPFAPVRLGEPINRIDGRLKVTGSADYTSDYRLPGMVWGCLVKSTVAKGKLIALDTAASEALPGVIKVYTSRNRPALYLPKPDPKAGQMVSEPLLPLSDDAIHYYGQDIAFVIAETYEQAREGALLVRATYAEEKPTASREASVPQPPKEVNGAKPHLERKDKGVSAVEDAWRQSPVRIDTTYQTAFVHHHPMEPHAVVARWEEGRLLFYTPTQWMYGTRNFLSNGLGIPKERVRVLSHYLGGGFGCKGSSWMYMLLTAAAARDLKRPVKFVMERENMFTSVGYRPMTRQRLQLGAARDGALLAIRHQAMSSGSKVGEFVEGAAHASSPVLYACPNIEVDHQVFPLDLNGGTFMRAPGESPGIYALESAMDELAVALGIDPLALRMKNYAVDHPMSGLPFSAKYLDECYRTGAAAFGWEKRNPAPGSMGDGEWQIGWGMATASYPAHRQPASARVRLLADGTAEVMCATQDLGTGMWTIVGQASSAALGLPLDRIKVEIGDSDLPEAPVSGGSSSTASVLPVIDAAARAALKKLGTLAVADAASPLYGLDPESLSPFGGNLQAKSDASRSESFRAILARAGQGAVDATEKIDPASETKQKGEQNPLAPKKSAYQSFGAFFVEVKVHRLTCETRVTRITAAMNIGKPMNLKTARSQVIGGTVFSVGAALTEHSLLDETTGRWITRDLGTYHIPVHADIPEIDVHFVGEPDFQFNPLGARGVGEIGNTGLAAAIGNAVWHATGARVRELPITPDKILEATATPLKRPAVSPA